jgi:hypothetical protein
LQAVVVGNLGADHVEIAVGMEVKLVSHAHRRYWCARGIG